MSDALLTFEVTARMEEESLTKRWFQSRGTKRSEALPAGGALDGASRSAVSKAAGSRTFPTGSRAGDVYLAPPRGLRVAEQQLVMASVTWELPPRGACGRASPEGQGWKSPPQAAASSPLLSDGEAEGPGDKRRQRGTDGSGAEDTTGGGVSRREVSTKLSRIPPKVHDDKKIKQVSSAKRLKEHHD